MIPETISTNVIAHHYFCYHNDDILIIITIIKMIIVRIKITIMKIIVISRNYLVENDRNECRNFLRRTNN